MSGALSHIRVLDLSRVLAGPWAGQVLADLGAEVIKVERPGVGDDTRHWGPPYLQAAEGNDSSEAAYFLTANRNKQSLTIDFTQPQGQQLVRDLVAKCDVLLENFKVGGLAAGRRSGCRADESWRGAYRYSYWPVCHHRHPRRSQSP